MKAVAGSVAIASHTGATAAAMRVWRRGGWTSDDDEGF